MAILEDFEGQLQRQWRMAIKAASRSCTVAYGSAELSPDLQKWPMTESFEVLGHTVQSNGSIRACWSKTKRGLWRAFWSNPGSRDARPLPSTTKFHLLGRAVLPQLLFRCSRWPPQPQIAKELDGIQRKMASTILNVPRLSGELSADYVRRRGRLAGQKCKSEGLWSNMWFNRAVRWDEHLARPRNANTWAARLRCFHDRNWFIQRRVSFLPYVMASSSPASALAGRTSTRVGQAKVNTRWHDGVHYARQRGVRESR